MALGIALSVAGIVISIGLYGYDAYKEAESEEQEFKRLLKLFEQLANRDARITRLGQPTINPDPYNSPAQKNHARKPALYAGVRFIVLSDLQKTETFYHVDFLTGTNKILFSKFDKVGDYTWKFRFQEERSPSEVRATLRERKLASNQGRNHGAAPATVMG
jgi:hypothetical protein